MANPDPRRGDEPTMDGDDDLQAGHLDDKQATDDVFPAGDSTAPQPDDEQPVGQSGE